MSLELQIAAASTFLLQSPPGEVNDCLNAVRTLVADDQELEIGILPALAQYNSEQFVNVEFQGKNVLITDDGQVSGQESRFIDPRSSLSFKFDHMVVTASDPKPFPTDPETESLRSELDKLLLSYSDAFYHDGVSAVYALPDENFPAVISEPILADEPATVVATAVATAEVEESVLPAPMDLEEEDGKEKVTDVEMEESKPEEALPEKLEVAEVVEDSITPLETVEEPLRSRIFSLYLVGSKNNPTNYWTGKWRSRYVVDYAKGTIEGIVKINVHYYEQGNVQLSTTLSSSSPISESQSSTSIIAAIKKLETNASDKISESYAELSDETFKSLRRLLPKTRSKLDWNKISLYNLSSELGISSAVPAI